MVEEAERHSKYHVDDAQDDGHLHLKGVEESQLVGGNIPDLQRAHSRFNEEHTQSTLLL